jgi:beta-galactosidase beta subunit
MIEMLSDKSFCFEYKNFEVHQHYIDCVIFIDGLNDFLEKELDININYQIN